MKPTALSVRLALLWLLIGIAASFWHSLYWLWLFYGCAFVVFTLVDGALLVRQTSITIERKLPARLPLGIRHEVELILHQASRYLLHVELTDAYPAHAEVEQLPWKGTLKPQHKISLFYSIRFLARGLHHFQPAHVWICSPCKLLQRKILAGNPSSIRVYPNYEPIIRYSLLAMDHAESQMGIVKQHRVGVSKEFHQLRDYHEGDLLTQIDWKASSKRLRLITREYQEQRDQNIVFLLDCGQRMRAMDGELTQFDHTLNALLLLAYIAIRQGDYVGVHGFGGTHRWLPPVKGHGAMPTLLNHLYDYQTTSQVSDFYEGVEQLMIQQKKRALVVLLTNIRSEDTGDLLPSLQLLRHKHLVLLANLRENEVDANLHKPVQNFDDALTYCSNALYLEERFELFEQLQSARVMVVDESAKKLPIRMTNKYFEIKNAGLL